MQFLAVSVACAEVSSCALYVLGHSVHDNGVVVLVKYPILHKHSLPVPIAEFVGHSHMMLVMHNSRHHTHQIQFCDLYIIYVMQTLKSPYIYVHNMKKNTLTSGRLCVLLPASCTLSKLKLQVGTLERCVAYEPHKGKTRVFGVCVLLQVPLS